MGEWDASIPEVIAPLQIAIGFLVVNHCAGYNELILFENI